jgi:DNA-binding transcriptional regulator YiaG
MPNVNAVINEQIRRLSRREIKTNTRVVRRANTRYRHDIASLKKQLAELTRRLGRVENQNPTADGHPADVEKGRFRAVGVKAHRAKLGLSAKDYARLVGVSSLTVYNWEHGKAKPRSKQVAAKWLAVRDMGKREALKRLGLNEPKAGQAAGKGTNGRRPRGKFKQTGEQTILSLLKNGHALATKQINDAWKKEGRAGTADVALGQMVKKGKLKRSKIKGQRGSQYVAA